MDSEDPYNWSVEQVCRFFRDDAQDLLSNLPNNPQLPTLPPFLEALKENDVSGFVLLTSVGTGDLRDDFGIRSFGQRSTLLHCINKLKECSSAHRGQYDKKESPQASTPMPKIEQPNPSETTPAEATTFAPSRPGEVQVQDEHGRKRRKLNLTANAAAIPITLPPNTEGCYFGEASKPVDRLFFDKTPLGREIEHPASDEFTILEADRANDSAEHNFQFHALSKPAGEAQYVFRQIHRCLNQDPIDLMRREQPALAIVPYREELSRLAKKVQSAIVVQYAGDGNLPVAIKENVAFLGNNGDYNGIAQESALGQFDYLNEKYGGGEQGDADGDSDVDSISSAAFDRMQAEIDKEWQDEQAELAASQATRLLAEDIENLVDDTVQSFAHEWNVSKRPSREQRQAWTVWKMMKGSKSRQISLIQDAKAKIDSYDRRLLGQKSHVVKAECGSKEEVVKLCEALKITVLDREEVKWKIDVWRRKHEPEHIVRHQKHTRTNASASAAHTIPAFVPQPEDRLSIEPGPSPALEGQEDVFVTPQGSPTPLQREIEDAGFDGSDEASRLDDFVEEDVQSLSDLPHSHTTVVSNLGEDDDDDEREDDAASPVTPQSVRAVQELGVRPSPKSSSTDGLPGMESFFATSSNKKAKKTSKHNFTKPSEPASASRLKHSTVIEISDDSTSASQSRSAKSAGRKAKDGLSQDAVVNSKPENSSVYDVDSWNIEELINNQDRKRVIIKLLRDEGVPALFAIKALWMRRKLVGVKEDVQKLLKTLRDEPTSSDARPGPLLQVTRLALVWSCLRPEIMKGDYPETIEWTPVGRDIEIFMPFFGLLMQKSDSKLFIEHESPSPSPIPNKYSEVDIIEIDSDSDIPVETPHARRKRKFKHSRKAVESQHTAMERQARYEAAETQSSNSRQLMEMVGSGSVLLPIDLLKQDKGVHHIRPAIASMMKEHQIAGVRFMWREITAGADADEDGQGCVLAHAMGLGKTMQTITLLVAVTEAAQSEDPLVSSQLPQNLRPAGVVNQERALRILILCPPSLLENWRREIHQWAGGILGNVFTFVKSSKSVQMEVLKDWHAMGGVLLMGYSLFGLRINRANAEEKAGKPHEDGDMLDEYLLRGPEILVADEAHYVRNIGAGISIAVNRIETRSRIALTGTPMSNDVSEMYALISFAAPGFLGGPLDFKVRFGEPIEQGTYADSSSYEQRRSKVKLATLSKLIEPKIHRADITALKGTLQPKVEFVITLPLTDLQRSVYNKYIEVLLGGGKNDEASQVAIFSWLSMLGLLTNHPLAFKRKLNEVKKPRKTKPGKTSKLDGGAASPIALDDDSAEAVDYEEEAVKTQNFSEETVKQITADIEDSTNPELSAKMEILMKILALSKRCGDKVLVFSSSIPTLNYVGELLGERGVRCGRICGNVPPVQRPKIIADLTEGLCDVLLISTKAGGVGLNIQAANRVVILDFGFNPSHEEQAIGRAYRFGQSKPVFVYRLINGGTFEDNIYNKQLFKTSLTQRVVDKRNPRRNAARNTRQYLYAPTEVSQQNLTEWLGKDPDVFDQILKPQLSQPEGIVRKVTTIETLQREGDDPPLNAEELRQAEEEYQTSIAAAMGLRGQIPNTQNLPPFVTAQASQPRRLMLKLPSPRQPSSTAPGGYVRPSPTIRIASTVPSSTIPPSTSTLMPHGLPSIRSP